MTEPAALLRLAADDNVAVAMRKIAKGETVELGGVRYEALDEVPLAHKMALVPIQPGQELKKFGVPIGRATRAIAAGELVHVHNIESDYIVNDVDHFED